ncbi:Aspartyl-tRNA(Asn) amidotransferase subunit C @ Glutamyl-tRNA(Gln) amidotransferase subunit C [invertebrate metagenome]|uniref:Aspartyl-tRNA(Asn) amidotransferase subunit C @ Glutamyl-tRNA(Gln) amidotransferase subunit C n=1 Tax=invertebrate metagenome TaxID=1711999 RepID=A0A484H7G6_9ZZZZ
MSLDKATVRTIAFLARLDVSEEKLEQLMDELSSILHWTRQLQEVETTSIEPMVCMATMRLHWRDDHIDDGACADVVLANAPESEFGFFYVPKVVE